MGKGRLSAGKRGYDARWRKARAEWLRVHPLCSACAQQGINTLARVVDHIVPHNGDSTLFWDSNNWQSLCYSCHSGIKRVAEHHGYSQSVNKDGVPTDPNHPWNRDQVGGRKR